MCRKNDFFRRRKPPMHEPVGTTCNDIFSHTKLNVVIHHQNYVETKHKKFQTPSYKIKPLSTPT